MNYSNLYNEIDAQDDLLNCDVFLDIDLGYDITNL